MSRANGKFVVDSHNLISQTRHVIWTGRNMDEARDEAAKLNQVAKDMDAARYVNYTTRKITR